MPGRGRPRNPRLALISKRLHEELIGRGRQLREAIQEPDVYGLSLQHLGHDRAIGNAVSDLCRQVVARWETPRRQRQAVSELQLRLIAEDEEGAEGQAGRLAREHRYCPAEDVLADAGRAAQARAAAFNLAWGTIRRCPAIPEEQARQVRVLFDDVDERLSG